MVWEAPAEVPHWQPHPLATSTWSLGAGPLGHSQGLSCCGAPGNRPRGDTLCHQGVGDAPIRAHTVSPVEPHRDHLQGAPAVAPTEKPPGPPFFRARHFWRK